MHVNIWCANRTDFTFRYLGIPVLPLLIETLPLKIGAEWKSLRRPRLGTPSLVQLSKLPRVVAQDILRWLFKWPSTIIYLRHRYKYSVVLPIRLCKSCIAKHSFMISRRMLFNVDTIGYNEFHSGKTSTSKAAKTGPTVTCITLKFDKLLREPN